MKKYLLLALLFAPFLAAQDLPCPIAYPPDACDTDVVGVSAVPDPPLLQGAINCWNLDEAVSAIREDDCGANDLTDGGVTDMDVGTGINNNGITTAGLDTCLQGSVVSFGLEWTINVWINGLSSFTQAAFVNDEFSISHAEGAMFLPGSWVLQIVGQSNARCAVPEPSAGLHMFTAWLHPNNNGGKIRCRIDNDPATEQEASLPFVPPTFSGTLFVGGVSSCTFNFNGSMVVDELSFWDRELSDASREDLLTTFAPF